MGSRALILDTDTVLRRSVAESLMGQGFEVVEDAHRWRGVAHVTEQNPEVIIMAEEETAPLKEGDLLSRLRRMTKAPIIVLGAGGEAASVNALLQGADMYLPIPIEHEELVSRVRALFRRSARGRPCTPLNPSFARGDGALEESVHPRVRSSLTETETRLLRCLFESKGVVVGHEELMCRVWGSPVKKGRLRFYICQLRRKLERSGPIRVVTRKGFGYGLADSVILS
ncbi:MAG: response regulator transcription factor [Dehalococcoidia bacterium]